MLLTVLAFVFDLLLALVVVLISWLLCEWIEERIEERHLKARRHPKRHIRLLRMSAHRIKHLRSHGRTPPPHVSPGLPDAAGGKPPRALVPEPDDDK